MTITPTIQRSAQLFTPLLTQFAGLAFFVVVGLALYTGWQNRAEQYLTAEEGLGYYLGIAGGSMMLALLLYPLRKNLRSLRNWGPIRYWFRMHMLFGVLGPACIMFHCNFGMGSLNSNVALFCMLLVAASGVVGRFFYTKIHYGLYGSQVSLGELGQVSSYSKGGLAEALGEAPELEQRLKAVEGWVMSPVRGVLHSMWRVLRFAVTRRWVHWRLFHLLNTTLKRNAQAHGWDRKTRRTHRRDARRFLQLYLDAARKVVEFSFYERLFALWHVIHLPFFLMMVVSGVVHVFAVHMY